MAAVLTLEKSPAYKMLNVYCDEGLDQIDKFCKGMIEISMFKMNKMVKSLSYKIYLYL